MTIDRELIDQIARLARIEMTEEEAGSMARHLGRILDHVAQLETLDTTGVPPMTGAVPMDCRFREDEVTPSLGVEQALQNAPETSGGAFLVPRVVAGETPRDGSTDGKLP